MQTSFAHFLRPLQTVLLVTVLSACATLPPPDTELAAARDAISRAETADADQHAQPVLAQARGELRQAQAALAAGRANDARQLAIAAAANGDLAHARSREAVVNQELMQRRNDIRDLRQRLELETQP